MLLKLASIFYSVLSEHKNAFAIRKEINGYLNMELN